MKALTGGCERFQIMPSMDDPLAGFQVSASLFQRKRPFPAPKPRLPLLALIGAAALSGCVRSTPSPPPQPPGTPAPAIVLTDDLGRQVRLERPAQRLVSLWPSATEMVCALGLEDRLVGVTSWCNYPPTVKKKTLIGDPNTPKLEKIVELQPDLVLAPFGTPREVLQQMEHLALPVFGMDPRTLPEVFAAMRQIGRLTGTEKAAESVVQALEKRSAAVEEKVRKLSLPQRPRVYLEMYASASEIWTFGPHNYADDLVQRAGGRNVFDDAETPYPQISAEQVLERNPDVLIIAHHQAAAADIRARPGWSSLTAVKENRIFRYGNPDEFLRPGPRLVNVLEWLARVLHPELFGPPPRTSADRHSGKKRWTS